MTDINCEETISKLEQKISELQKQLEEKQNSSLSSPRELQLLSDVIDHGNDAIFIIDTKDAQIIFANNKACEDTAYTHDELLHMKATDLLPPDSSVLNDWNERVENIRHLKRNVMTTNFVTKDGVVYPVEISGTLVNNEGQEYIVSIARNISYRTQTREKLRESTELYMALVESATDSIFALDRDGFFLSANPEAARYMGMERDELVGKHMSEVFPPEVASRQIESVRDVFETGKILKSPGRPIPTKTGQRWFDTVLSPVKHVDGEVRYVLGISRDLTDRVLAEQALRENEEKFRNFFNACPDFIYEAAIDGMFIDANETVLEWAGVSLEQIQELNVFDFFAGKDPGILSRVLERLANGEDIKGFKPIVKNKKGDVLFLEINAIPLKEQEDGCITTFLSYARDISDRIMAEQEKEYLQEQLLHSQKMESIGTLAGGMAHDFNNLLSVIMGNAEIAQNKSEKGSAVEQKLQKIINSANRARDLTMKLLTFARKEKLNVKTVEISSIINDLTDMLKRSISKMISIQTDFQRGIPPVAVDTNQIQQALLNICINAGDAMPEGGTLSITTREIVVEDPATGGHNNLKHGSYVLIEISDTGEGIPDRLLSKIFDPFFTTKDRGKGTGLGLSIAHGIINNHNGAIDVFNRSGGGATFRAYIPTATGSCSTDTEAENTDSQSGNSQTVLIIDDEPEFVDMTSEALELYGYHPIGATSGRQGVVEFQKNHRGIDLVLLDIRMPDMDGVAVYRQLKKIDPDVKVILCSGHSRKDQSSELIKDGPLPFIQKPFSIGELCESLSDAFAR